MRGIATAPNWPRDTVLGLDPRPLAIHSDIASKSNVMQQVSADAAIDSVRQHRFRLRRRNQRLQVLAGVRLLVPCEVLRCARCHDGAATRATFGPERGHPVRALHTIEV